MAGKKPKNYTKEVHLRVTEEMNESIKSVMDEEECSRPEAVRKLIRYGIQRYYRMKEIEEETLKSDYAKGGTGYETQAG